MPADFEPQEAVWFGWPKSQWFTEPGLDTRNSIAAIIDALSNHQVESRIMCSDANTEAAVKSWLTAKGYKITPYMKFIHIDPVDIWSRDFGPIFLKKDGGGLGMASFQQNQWGYSTTNDPTSKAMTQLPINVAKYLGLSDIISVSTVSEGGDRIVNGKGTLLVCRAVELQRNPQASVTSLESDYRKALGVEKIIWLNEGVREDLHADWGPIPYSDKSGRVLLLYGPQTTGGHLDEFVRFASPNRIVLAQVSEGEAASDPIAAVNYARLENAYRILSQATDQDGAPFDIVRIPTPDVMYMEVQPDQPMYTFLKGLKYLADVPTFPVGKPIYVVKSASYANYLVSNGVIVAPKYGLREKDDAVAQVLKTAYSGRDVVQINANPINYAGGGIHCSTQQQPA